VGVGLGPGVGDNVGVNATTDTGASVTVAPIVVLGYTAGEGLAFWFAQALNNIRNKNSIG